VTEKNVAFIDGITVSGTDLRLLLTALGQPDTTGGLSARSGVRPSVGDLAVSANGTPNMSVNVAAGSCFVTGTESFGQGLFVGHNDATKNLAIAAADATNARYDLIVARFYGETVAVGSRKFALEVVTGSPAASPADPAVPANATVLARVTVGAAATSITSGNITDRRVFFTTLGGTVPCLSTTRPANPFNGLHIFETDTGKQLAWNGTKWATPKDLIPESKTVLTSDSGAVGGTEGTVASSATINFDGTTEVEVAYSWYNIVASAGPVVFLVRLYDGTTQIAQHLILSTGSSPSGLLNMGGGLIRARVTPSSGDHTFTARLIRSGGTTETANVAASSITPAVLSVRQVVA
jgi:hypothetical protein